jgi:hypothetical protein
MKSAAVFVVLLLVASACGYHAPPVAVRGSPASLEPLTGEWWGDYVTDAQFGEHRGTITFRLDAGRDSARGDVTMTPEGGAPIAPRPSLNVPETTGSAAASPVLTIRFISASDGALYGELDPYVDPDRHLDAFTTFRGELRDAAIQGTFRTMFGNGAEVTGTWLVKRKTQ